MNNILRPLLYGTCLSILVGCASKGIPKHTKTTFLTRVSDSGLKHFQIQFEPNRQKNEAKKGPSRNTRSPRSSRSQFKKTQKLLLQAAEIKNQETLFCREGFWVLKNEADALRPYMRGECNDQASAADRKNFPQTLLRW